MILHILMTICNQDSFLLQIVTLKRMFFRIESEVFTMKQQNQALTKFKEEIASELHVDLKNGAENTSRENGRVGGEMVKRMIEKQMTQMK